MESLETAEELEVPHYSQQQQNVLDIGLLIETVQNYEYVFNISHKDYKNSKKKEEAWKEISEIVNANVDECMKAWKNVRDRFVKEKGKSRSGDEAPQTVWPYYDAMTFYSKYTKKRSSYSSVPPPKKIKKAEGEENRPGSAESVWSTMDTLLSPSSRSATPYLTDETDMPSKEKGKRKKPDEDVKQIIQTAQEIADSLKEKPAKNNSNKKFCEYVFERLEEMPDEEAKEKRKLMLQILEDF